MNQKALIYLEWNEFDGKMSSTETVLRICISSSWLRIDESESTHRFRVKWVWRKDEFDGNSPPKLHFINLTSEDESERKNWLQSVTTEASFSSLTVSWVRLLLSFAPQSTNHCALQCHTVHCLLLLNSTLLYNVCNWRDVFNSTLHFLFTEYPDLYNM